jgi:hypothetical protein
MKQFRLDRLSNYSIGVVLTLSAVMSMAQTARQVLGQAAVVPLASELAARIVSIRPSRISFQKDG